MPTAWLLKEMALRYAASNWFLLISCSTWMAIRSSRIFLDCENAVAAAFSFCVVAVRIRAFFTYCCAIDEPPWVGWCSASLIIARRVPLKSSAPCW